MPCKPMLYCSGERQTLQRCKTQPLHGASAVTTPLTTFAAKMTQQYDVKLFVAALAASLPMLMVGMFNTWTSPMLPVLLAEDSPIKVTPDEAIWITSFVPLGLLFSAVPIGLVGSRFGAKRIMLCSVAPALLSTQLAAASTTFSMLLVSRLLAGVYVGMTMTTVPSYLTDISRDSNRGLLGFISHVCNNLGCLFTYSLGPYVEFRNYQLLSSVVPIVFLMVFIWMPESPYFLMASGRREEAALALAALRGHKDTAAVQSELDQINLNLGEKNISRGKIASLFSTRGNRRAFAVLIALISLMLLCGHGVIMSYAGMIFHVSGSSLNPEACSIILGVVQLISSIAASTVVDRFGRRPLMIVSTLGVAIALIPEIVYFILKDQPGVDTTSFGWVPLTFLILFVVMFSLGLGPLPLLIISELFPSNVKGIALSLGAIFGCILAFVVMEVYLLMAQHFGLQLTFFISSICCILGAILLMLILPETKGMPLMEITDILNGVKKPIDSTNSTDPELPNSVTFSNSSKKFKSKKGIDSTYI